MPVIVFLILILSSYMFLSASSITWDSKSPCLNSWVPIEKLTLNIASEAFNFLETILSRKSCNFLLAVSLSISSGKITKNSSPPYLIVLCSTCFNLFAINIKTLSPTICPCVSFISLK